MTNFENYELRRKFEIMAKIKYSDEMKFSIKYMTISNDMNYILIIDKNKNVFILDGKLDDENNKKIVDNQVAKKRFDSSQYGKDCSSK